jgi:hypothetical protein
MNRERKDSILGCIKTSQIIFNEATQHEVVSGKTTCYKVETRVEPVRRNPSEPWKGPLKCWGYRGDTLLRYCPCRQ